MLPQSRPQSAVVSALALAAAVAIVASYFVPLWWVSLTAPNYPKDAFPDGIRIHFFFKGVENGCTTPPVTSRVAQETQQEDLGWRSEQGKPAEKESASLDCVHEMNTINHYVGMHPIGFGAPVELYMSEYIVAILATMLLGFAIPRPKARVVVMGVLFAGISGWMLFDLFVSGRGPAFIEQFKEDAGKYFREVDKINAWGVTVQHWFVGTTLVFIGLMAFFTFASAKWPGAQLSLGIVPAILPVFFLASYGGWLYYFGHSLHPWGAFTVKPFMPTVFGDGKVAQFTTHSYPHLGFGLLAFATIAAVLAVAWRRNELSTAAAAPKAG